MQRLKLFIPLIIFLVLAAAFFIVEIQIKEGEFDPMAMPSALEGKPLPQFAAEDLLTGQVISQQQLVGEVALINVWATWCPSCHAEHEFLNQLAKRNVVIYGVDYKDDAAAARDWIAQKGNPYRYNLFDPQGTIGLDLGVTGAPETYVIDHRGQVQMRYQGPLNERVWQEKLLPLIIELQQAQLVEAS